MARTPSRIAKRPVIRGAVYDWRAVKTKCNPRPAIAISTVAMARTESADVASSTKAPTVSMSTIAIKRMSAAAHAASAPSTMTSPTLGERSGGQSKKHNDDHDFLHIRPPCPLRLRATTHGTQQSADQSKRGPNPLQSMPKAHFAGRDAPLRWLIWAIRKSFDFQGVSSSVGSHAHEEGSSKGDQKTRRKDDTEKVLGAGCTACPALGNDESYVIVLFVRAELPNFFDDRLKQGL